MSVSTWPATIGFFRSPAAIRNFSMDRYADSLAAALRRHYAGAAVIDEVRPGARRPDLGRRSPLVGRITNFASRYPSYLLQARSTHFAVNHITDQADGHLTYALNPLRTIVSCHDIFPLKHWHGTIRGLPRRMTPPVTVLASLSGMRRAKFIVTSTRATKRDLVAEMGIDPVRIHVVPYGLDEEFRRLSHDDRAKARACLPHGDPNTRYILSVDTGVPYKNRRAAIEVLARVRARCAADVRLLRVGPALSGSDRAFAAGCGVENAIVELGSLSRDELATTYNRCDVLLFPSLYEGFGWPPLEAMACGLPVIASSSPAITEVVGGAALQADALDYDALAANTIEVLEGRASVLVERGLARARVFTWERAARDMADLYDAIIGGYTGASGIGTKTKVVTPCAA